MPQRKKSTTPRKNTADAANTGETNQKRPRKASAPRTTKPTAGTPAKQTAAQPPAANVVTSPAESTTAPTPVGATPPPPKAPPVPNPSERGHAELHLAPHQLEQAIRERAYYIYLERGTPGDPVADWHRAETEIKSLFA